MNKIDNNLSYDEGKRTFYLKNGLEIILGDDAYPEYNSGHDGWTYLDPNNWIVCPSQGNDGETYELWYRLTEKESAMLNSGEMGLDEIDYSRPYAIEAYGGERVYIIEGGI